MQSLENLEILDIIMVETFLAFLVLVSIGFYRFSKDTRFQKWSIGWIMYTAGAVTVVFNQAFIMELIDIVAITLTTTGAMIIAGEAKQIGCKYRGNALYFYTFILGLGWSTFSYFLQIHPAIVYSFPAGIMAYACVISAREMSKLDLDSRLALRGAIAGFGLITFSSFLVPLLIFFELINTLALLQATGLIMVATSMNSVLVRLVSKSRRVQHQVSQLMMSVVQHDIRNYLQLAMASLEFGSEDSAQREYWLETANESLQRAQNFVDEMREIGIALTRYSPILSSFMLKGALTEVVERARREYALQSDHVFVSISDTTVIMSNTLVKELVWNIVDNSFKHGSQDLIIKEELMNNSKCILTISDSAGGLPTEVKDFLTGKEESPTVIAPGQGLGIGLIRGLAPLCGTKMQVEDRIVDEEIIGTTYLLEFDCPNVDCTID